MHRRLTSPVWCVCLCLCILVFIVSSSDAQGESRGPLHTDSPSTQIRTPEGKCLVFDMMEHSLYTYFHQAFPYDSLDVLGKRGAHGTVKGLVTTLIDMLDTLAVTGHINTFCFAIKWISTHIKSFDIDVSVNVFETNIRVLGGLLSAHMMLEEGVIPMEKDGCASYDGHLLALAVDLADRLLVAFNSSSGIPYDIVGLHNKEKEGRITSASQGGTLLLEFGLLSRLTGNASYLNAAELAVEELFFLRDGKTKLLGSHIDVENRSWMLPYASIGSGLDSMMEYLFKYHVVSGEERWWSYFDSMRASALKYLRQRDAYSRVHFEKPLELISSGHESLSSFYPGLLLTSGHMDEGTEPLWFAHSIFHRYGAMPERQRRHFQFSPFIPNYPLRPEHIESIYYYYRTTHDPAYKAMAEEFALGLHLRCRTPWGFTPLTDVGFPYHESIHNGSITESFWISETLKYLWMVFDEDPTPGNWVLTTEAHHLPDQPWLWWTPTQWTRQGQVSEAGEEHGAEEDSRNRWVSRLKAVRELKNFFHLRRSQPSGHARTRFRKYEHLAEEPVANYVCQNHPQTGLQRLSHSLYRSRE